MDQGTLKIVIDTECPPMVNSSRISLLSHHFRPHLAKAALLENGIGSLDGYVACEGDSYTVNDQTCV